MKVFWRFAREDAGAETVEYALVIGFMSLAAVAGITAAGVSVSALWNGLASRISTLIGTVP